MLPILRSRLTAAFGRVFARRQQICVVISVKFLVHPTQSHLAEQHQPCVVFARGEAIVGRFGDHISEVDSFAEHIAGDWSLGRRNS